jgi:uncharacterized membrane protein YeaQ/YmgE (transglycosylase-associated protein family)
MGVATGLWFKRNADYLVIDILAGIAGSILGLFLVFMANDAESFGLFSWSGVAAGILGAAAFISLYQTLLALPKHKHKNIKGSEQ